ncbi:MAG: tyrosine-type recombinase/integrase [Deltaproteobacteria bacterium]|nr:tyrosine-type recombinase/integrase [Deltaproteobacteria bacterium]
MSGYPKTQISGPLSDFVSNVYRHMRSEGYAVLSAAHALNMMAHLSRWMQEHGLSVAELQPDRIEEFFRHRRNIGYTNFTSAQAMEPIVRALQRSGVELPGPADSDEPHEKLLTRFAQYLKSERCLAISTVKAYSVVARRFLHERFGEEPPTPHDLIAVDVTGYVIRASRRVSVGACKYEVCALRALLRWLYVRGELDSDLAGCVPAVAGWRQTSLPTGLESDDVECLLRSCDRRKSIGRRDYAVLLSMVRMGLRAGEVAALELDDVDWSAGEILVHGKGSKHVLLPLPHEIGEAIAAYLKRGRPRRSCRKLFLRSRAPYGGLGNSAIGEITRRAFERAGLKSPKRGAHVLRHTAATQMLRRGGSLCEIAQVLRHSHIDTTAIYAKVDREVLHELVQPWAGGEA